MHIRVWIKAQAIIICNIRVIVHVRYVERNYQDLQSVSVMDAPSSLGKNILLIYRQKKRNPQTNPISLIDRKMKHSQAQYITNLSRKGKTMQENVKESNEVLVARYQTESDHVLKNEILGILYQNNLNMIKKIANRYVSYVDFDDLMQEAYFGLRVAADMYAQDQGTKFMTYAVIWLKQSMRRYIDNYGSSVRLPAHKHNSVYKLDKIANAFSMEFGREPSDQELCSLLDIGKDKLERLKKDKTRLRIRSLDAPIAQEDDSCTLGDTIADGHDYTDEVIEIHDNERLRLVIWDEVNARLSEREENVIIKRFKCNMTLNEIGFDMGITPEGVRCIQAQAMRKLRQSNIIKQYNEDIISRAYIGTGLASFHRNGTSATEKTAITMYEKGLDAYIRYIEKEKQYKAK